VTRRGGATGEGGGGLWSLAWRRCRARRGELGEAGEAVELGGALRPLFIGGQGGGDESGAAGGGAALGRR